VERYKVEEGEPTHEILPVIAIDLVLRIVPPPGGEIEFAQIRELIKRLRDVHGLPIKYVTTDGFQSVDLRQIMRKYGFQTDYLSVEKIEPWRAFRDAVYDTRVLVPQHQYLLKELSELETTIINNKEKVDHRPQGSKDVADAVCGVVSFLLNRRAAWAGIAVSSRTGTHLLGTDAAREAAAASAGNTDIDRDAASTTSSRLKRPTMKRQTVERKRLTRR